MANSGWSRRPAAHIEQCRVSNVDGIALRFFRRTAEKDCLPISEAFCPHVPHFVYFITNRLASAVSAQEQIGEPENISRVYVLRVV
jgi:hypothetical protein